MDVRDARYHMLESTENTNKCSGPPCCDFCEQYDYNGDEHGVYIELGWCRLLKQRKDPGNYCDKYRCKYCNKKEAI